jgi:hypothetical protein
VARRGRGKGAMLLVAHGDIGSARPVLGGGGDAGGMAGPRRTGARARTGQGHWWRHGNMRPRWRQCWRDAGGAGRGGALVARG